MENLSRQHDQRSHKDKLTNFDLVSPSTTPIRELSPDSEASSTQQESATVSPSISQHTQHEDNLSDVDADLDDLVSLDDDDDREQVFNMVDEAQRMAENPSSVPLGMTPEPEHVDHSRPALAQISHHSSRLQEDSDRPRPAFPNYLMDEYLEMHPISVEIPIDKRLQSATSTAGRFLTEKRDFDIVKGEQYQPGDVVEKLKSGSALNGLDNAMWLRDLSQAAINATSKHEVVVVSYLALKRTHRKFFRSAVIDHDKANEKSGPKYLLRNQYKTLEISRSGDKGELSIDCTIINAGKEVEWMLKSLEDILEAFVS
ncbi:hypothetical protein IFR04_015565 [Cadophora malorum]|uniref:Uncharacterized protein n=1 Tax=Cadophora malorum TaxID=108018 RepID=A0A8H7T2N7_9HELO|nr:hypothetical protein IFR04_015565 [Cadophora malorum]